MRDKLLTDKTVVMTSATLMLGGDFAAVATSVGLKPSERVRARRRAATADDALPWVGLDVGSPFDYGQQAILYVARHLPPPGRDGLVKAQLDEIVELVDAAEGRTLGLFSSRRAAEAAAEEVRAPPAAPDHARPGRGPAARAGQAVRRRPPHLPLRHPQPVAGPRRARRDLPARADRPDPVPAPRRPADERAPEGRRHRPAATASCRSPPPTPRCCWPRARAG